MVVGESVIINKGALFLVVFVVVRSAEFAIFHALRAEKSFEATGAACAVVRYGQVARDTKESELSVRGDRLSAVFLVLRILFICKSACSFTDTLY